MATQRGFLPYVQHAYIAEAVDCPEQASRRPIDRLAKPQQKLATHGISSARQPDIDIRRGDQEQQVRVATAQGKDVDPNWQQRFERPRIQR